MEPRDFADVTYLQAARRVLGRDGLNRSKVLALLEHARDRTELYPASTKYHHVWAGGLADHITQVMLLMNEMRFMVMDEKVKPWEIVVAAYLHDWEKHWKYEPDEKKFPELSADRLGIAVLARNDVFTYYQCERRVGPSHEVAMGVLLERFGLKATLALSNALMLSEGGYSAHAKDREGQLGPLATILHAADMISSHCLHEVSGEGARKWAHKNIDDVFQAHYSAKPLGDGTWPR